jgi:hypothetical protein
MRDHRGVGVGAGRRCLRRAIATDAGGIENVGDDASADVYGAHGPDDLPPGVEAGQRQTEACRVERTLAVGETAGDLR